MTRPERFLTRMILFLVVVGSVAALLFPALRSAFMNNPALNGLILGTLLAGILFIFRQVLMLRPEVAWLEHFQTSGTATGGPEPVLLAPMARMPRSTTLAVVSAAWSLAIAVRVGIRWPSSISAAAALATAPLPGPRSSARPAA